MARVAFTAGLAIASSHSAHAAVWTNAAQGSVRYGYDDNTRMSVQTSPTVNYASTEFTDELSLQTESLSWTLDPRVVLMRYDHDSELNRTETYVTSSLLHQSDTGQSSLQFNWTQDTTLTSEFGSTSLAGVNKRHQASALTMSHGQQWTERFSTQSMLYATANHYMKAQNTGLVNYNYGRAQLDLQYSLTRHSQLSLDFSIGKLQVPNQPEYGKVNQSATLTYTRTFAERWSAKLSAGPSQVKSDFSKESGTVYEFNISRKAEISSLQLKLTRDITPTGQGTLSRRQQLSLTAYRDLTERINLSLTGSAIQSDTLLLSRNLNFYGVRYNDININLGWRWTPTVTLSITAGHADQRQQNVDQLAKRNYASLNLFWSGLTHTLH